MFNNCRVFVPAQAAHALLQDRGITQLRLLSAATQERGMWSNTTLQSLLRNETPLDTKGELSSDFRVHT